jgi:hypothetical protein
VKSFAAGIVVQLASGVVYGVFFLVWTLYMQIGLGWSALRAGFNVVPFSIAVSIAAGISVQVLVPRFGRKVLQAGALSMAVGMLIFIWEAGRYGTGIEFWQTCLPLAVMGIGLGLIVAPLTETALSEVPHEHSGAASGLINMMQQLGTTLGLGLTSVFFFRTIKEDLTPQAVGTAYVNAFQNSLWWGDGLLVAVFLLMFGLPAMPKQQIKAEEAQEPSLPS